MQLVKFLNKLFKKGGFILEDAYGKEHVIGNPDSEKPIKLKIHNKNHEDFIYEIVEILTIKPSELEYNYSKNIFYDLTLIIGKDYKDLDSYSEVTMHYEPF